MSEQHPKILEAFKPYESFCKALLDAYVVVDSKGKILKVNTAASAVTGMTSKQLLKLNSLQDALKMRLGDANFDCSDILQNSTPSRFDDIQGTTSDGKELFLTIGSFPFVQNDTVIGAFILLRDVTAETQLQGKYKVTATKSVTDPLTGLYNRAHFEEYLQIEEHKISTLPSGNDHQNLTMIMGDIDHFKKINDKFGHPAGDYIIKTVAQLLSKTFRKTDIICRYGGEEFLIILPASDLEGSKTAAEKARQSIENYAFEFEGTKIPVTMSMGVAQLIVGSETGKDTIARADAALYQSKQSGRNQVSTHNGKTIHSPGRTGQGAA